MQKAIVIRHEQVPIALTEMLERMDTIEDNISFLVRQAKQKRKKRSPSNASKIQSLNGDSNG